MIICTWNINGLRSILKKDFIQHNKKSKTNTFSTFVEESNYDIICFNETKISDEKMKEFSDILPSYPYRYYTHSQKKLGYSGVSIYSKIEPIQEIETFDDNEGRILCIEFQPFYLVAVYTPNAGSHLQRLEYRTKEWDKQFRSFVKRLLKTKEVIIAGDLNVAYEDIDIHKPDIHRNKSAGFTDAERSNFGKLLELGLIDSFRYMNPTSKEYTYFDYRSRARMRNAGWRIDYILVSEKLKKKIISSYIDPTVYGSDHIPIISEIKL